MGQRKRMAHRYRRFSYLSDIEGAKSAIGEMRGLFFPPQPVLNKTGLNKSPGTPFRPDEAWFEKTIGETVASHPDNAMEYPFFGEKIFMAPMVGFLRGNDPIFDELKTIIGPHHFSPWEIMAWQAKKNGVEPPEPDEISVVSFVMPMNPATKKDNGGEKEWLAERWAQTRLLGEMFSQTMVREIVTFLMGQGILAVSPDVTLKFNKKRYPKVGWASPWSHRHIAYAAGLGTFGMHDFFITEKGCAHRLGSFVVRANLQPNRKRPADVYAFCLEKQGISCLKCARRCPVGAITKEDAHDKDACASRVAKSLAYCNSRYHIFIYGCGLCATAVPCESGIPAPLDPERNQK